MSRIIKIFDTTLRDGEQSPGCSMNIEEKLMVARQLARMKVDIIEAGFPVASEGDFQAVKRIAEEIKGPVICGLCRATEKDIDRGAEAIRPAGNRRTTACRSSTPTCATGATPTSRPRRTSGARSAPTSATS